MPPKRGRDPLDDPKSGPSKHQLKGLAYVGKQPSFLRNAAAALSGQTGSSGNRAPIPTRPEGYGDDDQDDAASDRDDWDLDRGDDEAPQVVVLKEGKHIGKDEVDRIRAEGELARMAMLTPGEVLCPSADYITRPDWQPKRPIPKIRSTRPIPPQPQREKDRSLSLRALQPRPRQAAPEGTEIGQTSSGLRETTTA